MEKLEQLREEFPSLIIEIRGKGLLLGIELARDGDPIVRECLEKGMLVNCAAGNVLRLVPPLIVQKKDIDRLIDVLEEVFAKLTRI